MSHILKNTAKFAVGTCLTLGVVTVGVSVVTAGSIGKVLYAGVKAAHKAMKEEFETLISEVESSDKQKYSVKKDEVVITDVSETISIDNQIIHKNEDDLRSAKFKVCFNLVFYNNL